MLALSHRRSEHKLQDNYAPINSEGQTMFLDCEWLDDLPRQECNI